MSELALIKDLALIWGVALASGYACSKLKQPVLTGYIIGGVVVGPSGLGWIQQGDQVRVLAELGAAVLLFALGVELSLRRVLQSAGKTILAGTVQIVLTILAVWAITAAWGTAQSVASGFLFGCVCALSSSLVISKVLMDRGEADSIHGQILIQMNLVQDLSLVVIIPFLPVLASGSSLLSVDVLLSAGKAVLFVLAVVFGATKIVPPFLAQAARANTRELFILTVLVVCFSIALLSQALGLSIALGAFLAGLMISGSSYSHQALHDVMPLKDVFSTVFFVSIGMLLNPAFIAAHWLDVSLFVFLLIAIKALIGAGSALIITRHVRSAILTGVGLSQIGEFSFILLTLGYSNKLINDAMYNLFFAGAVVSMMASPALMSVVPRLLARYAPSREKLENKKDRSRFSNLKDHIILCGFGRIGRNLGIVLETHQIPFIVIELNAGIIDDLNERNIHHIYGDASSRIVLLRANLKQASCLILTMPDPLETVWVATFARQRNPDIKIIARAHRTEDIEVFRSAGINAVVQPEFEASIEITRLALHGVQWKSTDIERALDQIRQHRYLVFRPDIGSVGDSEFHFDEGQFGVWFKVRDESLTGKSLRKLDIRRRTGATVTAVKRSEKTMAYPDPSTELSEGDEIFVVGSHEQHQRFEQEFAMPRFCPISESTSDTITPVKASPEAT